MADVSKGLTAQDAQINKYSLSKCGHSTAGAPSKEKSSPNKYSLANISKSPAK